MRPLGRLYAVGDMQAGKLLLFAETRPYGHSRKSHAYSRMIAVPSFMVVERPEPGAWGDVVVKDAWHPKPDIGKLPAFLKPSSKG